MLNCLLQAVIESINRKKGRAKVRFHELYYRCSNSCSRSQVRFIGFNNMEEKEVDELFLSKGEERRKEQESRGEGGIRFSTSGTYMSVIYASLSIQWSLEIYAEMHVSKKLIFAGRMRSMT